MGHNEEPSMSADTVSALFPDRPIRPLPKRRLRERLSPEVADSIQYPPTPQQSSSLFYYPYSTREDEDSTSSASRERSTEVEARQNRRNGTAVTAGEGEGDDEGIGTRAIGVVRSDPDIALRSGRPPPKSDPGRQPNPKPPLSATSPVDGYDLFENTNNKKKRKIPTVGESALTGSRYTVDPETGETTLIKPDPDMGEPLHSGASAPYSTSVPYYMSSNASSGAQNVPGPGRGRYGRVRNGRSPLRALSDSTNNWARRTGSNNKLGPGLVPMSQSENTGIISSAIANAEKLPPEPGQENISLLQQQQATNTLASGPFTFTCDSQVPGSLAWPGSDRRPAMGQHKTSPSPAGASQDRLPGAPTTQAGATQPQATEPAPQAPKRSTSQDQVALKKEQARKDRREWKRFAKERQRRTQHQNKLHPPKPEDVWICEVCEYEAIFGEKPRSFVRIYEEKELKGRRDQEKRKAALAKRLQNPRKGAKKSRAANKQNMNQQAQYSHDIHQNPSQGHSDEPYEDEYDDEDVDEYEHEHEHCEDCAHHHHHPHEHEHDEMPPLIPGDGGGGGGVR